MGFVATAWAAADYLSEPATTDELAVQALTAPVETTARATTSWATTTPTTTTPPVSSTPRTITPPTTGELASATTTGPPPTSPPITQPTTAPAPTATAAPQADHDARGAAALARISYPWQSKLPGWTIEFNASRSGVLGYTFTTEKRIEVYVRDSMSEGLLAHVVAHEIGHAVDVSRNSGSERRSWLEARGVPDAQWWPGEGGVSDFKSGAGDFAEGFAAWQVGTGSYRSKLGSAPNSEQLELMAQLSN